jgi:hypothetical protein
MKILGIFNKGGISGCRCAFYNLSNPCRRKLYLGSHKFNCVEYPKRFFKAPDFVWARDILPVPVRRSLQLFVHTL